MLSGKFDVQIREEDGYAVIQTEGYLNGPRGESLAETAKDLMQKGYTRFVINLAETRLINSIGISILIEIIELLEERQGILNFCGLTPTIEHTFQLVALARYAGIFPDEDSAIAALNSP